MFHRIKKKELVYLSLYIFIYRSIYIEGEGCSKKPHRLGEGVTVKAGRGVEL